MPFQMMGINYILLCLKFAIPYFGNIHPDVIKYPIMFKYHLFERTFELLRLICFQPIKIFYFILKFDISTRIIYLVRQLIFYTLRVYYPFRLILIKDIKSYDTKNRIFILVYINFPFKISIV